MNIDVFADDVRRDPYPWYGRMRDDDPVHWDERARSWIVTRYDDAAGLLAHPRVAHWGGQQKAGDPGESTGRGLGRWLHLMDPRTGSTLRKLVAAGLAPHTLDETRRLLEARAAELLDAVEGRERFDAVTEFAAPFTLTAAAKLIGVPREEHDRFQEVALGASGALFNALTGAGVVDAAAAERIASLAEFIAGVFKYRLANPGRDLITAILQAQDAGDGFDEEDYLPFLAFFLFASHENMVNFVGNSIRALARHPRQLQRLRETPELIRNAVDELLRYDSPVQFLMIRVLEDIRVSGTSIPAGDSIFVCVGSANRDPSRFADPDCLDLGRCATGHLSFGAGPLTCVGASLARLEGQIAIAAIADRFQGPLVEHAVTWRRTPPVLRGAESLVIMPGCSDA